MAKIDNILLLVNALQNRSCLTIDKIRDICGVSARTAHRYIRVLSEANIPVYFDSAAGGYRLSRSVGFKMDMLTTNDVVLLCVALSFLKTCVNAQYQLSIESLARKIFSMRTDELEEIWGRIQEQLESKAADRDISGVLTSQIIYAAILLEKRLRLVESTGEAIDRFLELSDPKICFDHGWSVVEDHPARNKPILWENVLEASLVDSE
jgi:predicted DNA-binding transcriptional regulator YafY